MTQKSLKGWLRGMGCKTISRVRLIAAEANAAKGGVMPKPRVNGSAAQPDRQRFH